MRKSAFGDVAVVTALAVLASCGGGQRTEPYPRASLRSLTRGRLPASVGFRYLLVNPSIESLYGNVGLVRDGNIVEFIKGRNLEDKLAEKPGGVELAVVKEFSPFVHFRVERIYAGRDTVFLTPGSASLPRIVDASAFSAAPYERIDADEVFSAPADALGGLESRKIRVSCGIAEERGENGPYFVLLGQAGRLRAAAVPDGIGAVLRLLAERGYPFEGGVVLTATEDPAPRPGSGIAAVARIDWVLYGRRVVLP